MPKLARTITVVALDGRSAKVIYEKPSKRKRASPWLQPLEHIERHLLRAQQSYADELLRRHERSNQRESDGWIEDAATNLYKASRRAYRTYRRIAPSLLPK
jgi:Family of unknown function (DUF6312)